MIIRMIKLLLAVVAVFGLVVVGNVFFGDLSVPTETITETVVIDVN